jgi:hypothetical protein
MYTSNESQTLPTLSNFANKLTLNFCYCKRTITRTIAKKLQNKQIKIIPDPAGRASTTNLISEAMPFHNKQHSHFIIGTTNL